VATHGWHLGRSSCWCLPHTSVISTCPTFLCSLKLKANHRHLSWRHSERSSELALCRALLYTLVWSEVLPRRAEPCAKALQGGPCALQRPMSRQDGACVDTVPGTCTEQWRWHRPLLREPLVHTSAATQQSGWCDSHRLIIAPLTLKT